MSWLVYQLADVLHRVEEHVEGALTTLGRADDKQPGDVFPIRPKRMARLKDAVDELTELAEQARQHMESLPETSVRVRYDDAAEEAMQELAEGKILDGRRALLAAGMAPTAEGLRAFAQGLRVSDAQTAWHDVTLRGMLTKFNVTPHVIRRIANDARLTPGAELALCEPDETARLAARLEAHVNGEV